MARKIPPGQARRSALQGAREEVSLIVLVDTDVLVDLALGREPHAASAAGLLDLLEERPGTGFVAWHSISNFYYIVAPKRGRAGVLKFLMELTRFIGVAPTTTESLRYAGRLDMRDFEDAMQVAAGMACGAEVIATRNVHDYSNAPIRAVHPVDLLKQKSP